MTMPRLSNSLVLLIVLITTDSAGAQLPTQSARPDTCEDAEWTSEPLTPLLTGLTNGTPKIQICDATVQRKRLHGKIDRAIVLAAQQQLTLPMGSGRQMFVCGKPYWFCLELHYHEPGSGRGPDGWHKGVTVYDDN